LPYCAGRLVPNADQLVECLGPFAAFVVATFDRSGLPLILGTVCGAVGAAGGHIVPTVALGTLGMIAGDLALYELGRKTGSGGAFGRRLLRPLLPLRATARAFLRRRPGVSLAFGRYVAGAGILLPWLAGSTGMKRGRVYAILIGASIAYAVPWATGAFLLGQSFVASMDALGTTLGWVAVGALVLAAAAYADLRIRRRARKAAAHARLRPVSPP
jgi:membrane protein DedA with SNARE-associated domain